MNKSVRLCIWVVLFAIPPCKPSATCAAGVGPVPQWIWSDSLPQAGQVARLRTEFDLPTAVKEAELSGLADDTAILYLNGRRMGEVSGYKRWAPFDAAPLLRPGANVLAVQSENRSGHAGVAIRLRLRLDDGSQRFIVSDPTWRRAEGEVAIADSGWLAADFADEARPYAASFGLVGIPPWGEPEGESGDYYQWERAKAGSQATAAEEILAAAGFEVELLRSAQPGEDSWISLAFDPRGRLLIGKEGRIDGPGLLRFTLPEEAGGEILVEAADESLHEPRGLLFAHDSLYANANNDKTLVRLRDRDDDGRFEEIASLRTTPGDVGHGRNNLVSGPEGGIWLIHGNDVRLPDDFNPADSRFAVLEQDRLLPCRWDRFLFDTQARLPAGHVIRTDRDGKAWELFAGCLRNPYGLDFNRDGELFTFDADNEGDLGTPWFRPTRVNHLVSGGDYGWRQGTAMRPDWFPDSAPSTVVIGLSSPTDVKFGTQSRFPPAYRRCLFILDWSYGKVYAVDLLPRGASYAGCVETFLEGRPLNVTDLDFGPDGWMYFVTGGRGTQSGLYRVRYVGPETVEPEPASDELLAAETTAAARQARHSLEAFHARRNERAVPTAWPFLADPDPWLRQAARVAIEHQPVDEWRQRALEEERPLAAGTALMALARRGQLFDLLSVHIRLDSLPLASYTAEQQLVALRAYQLAFLRTGVGWDSEPQLDGRTNRPPMVVKATRQIEGLFPGGCLPVNQLACELLVYLDSPEVVPRTMELLAAASRQEEKLLWLYELRNVRQGWTLDTRREYLAQLAAAEQFTGGRELPIAIFSIGGEFRATLTPDEALALAPLLAAPAHSEAATSERPLVKEWELDGLIAAIEGATGEPDLTRGRKVFSEAQCGRCHRFAGEGRPIGPDLAAVSHRFGRRDLLDTMLAPSKYVDAKYQDTTFAMNSGLVITGRIVGGDDDALLVATNAHSPFDVTTVRLAEVESQAAAQVSPMPTGLLNTFSAEEIRDLAAWLESDGRFGR